MRFRWPGLILVVSLMFVCTGVWLAGCGAGNPSGLFYTSGLLLPGAGGGGTLPDPDQGVDGDEDGDGDGGGEGETICIVFFNNSDLTARVDLYASTSNTILFDELRVTDNLVFLPELEQGCIADPDGPFGIRPPILDNGQLSYQRDCASSNSLLFGVLDENGTVGTEDQFFGPLRQGVDFNCGDTLNIELTDEDQDDQLEIDFL